MRNTKCRKPKADYHFCQLQHGFQGMVEGRGRGSKLWLIYLSICRRQQKANNASNAQNIPKGKACEWHKKRQAATIQKLQLLTLLNLHVFSFCFWTAQTFLGLVWARIRVPIDPPTSHCHLLLALTQMSRPLMQYISATSLFSGQVMYKYIPDRKPLRSSTRLGVMMTTVHLKVICFDCVENMHLHMHMQQP